MKVLFSTLSLCVVLSNFFMLSYGSISINHCDGLADLGKNPLIFDQSLNSDASLSSLTIDGSLIAEFNATITTYHVVLSYKTTIIPVIAAKTNDGKANTVTTQSSSLPGVASVVVTAEDGVTKTTYTINFHMVVNIPDQNFKQFLVGSGFDTNQDGKFYTTELEPIQSLDISTMGIRDLTGIDAFPNLITLACTRNQISYLDLSKNEKLKNLYCSINSLTSLDLTHNIELNNLACSNNQITNIDVSTCYHLEQINCQNNKLSSLNISNNAFLLMVECSNNQITHLDLSNKRQLEHLNCSYNLLSSLDLSVSNHLIVLGCSNNQLQSLVLPEYGKLETINCSNNKLTNLVLTRSTNLESVFCQNNMLSNLSLLSNSMIRLLYCNNNLLTTLDLSANNWLREILLNDNPYLKKVCVWKSPFPPAGITVDINNSPNVAFTTDCSTSAIATLSKITVNGNALADFNPEVYTYNLTLPSSILPVVDATCTSPFAEKHISQAAGLPGTTEVIVTAEDGVTNKKYTINFTVSESLVSFMSASQSCNESATITLGIQLSSVCTDDVSIPFSIRGTSTATGGGIDYSLLTTSPVVIQAGSTSANILLSVMNDALAENDETIIIDLGTPVNSQLGTITSHTISISDNAPLPSVQFANSGFRVVNEGGIITNSIRLSTISNQDVIIPFSINPASTVTGGGVDYTITASPVTIPAGSLSVDISMKIIDDELKEDDETIIIDLETPTNATLAAINTKWIGTIGANDGGGVPSVSFWSASQACNESGVLTLVVKLSSACAKDVTVPFTIRNTSTATGDGVDYSLLTSSPVVIPAGSTSANILLSVTNDALDENNETIIVDLGTPVNCQLGLTSSHAISISDDDPSPSVSFWSASQACNESGILTLVVKLSSACTKDVTVPFTIRNTSTATGDGVDYSLLTSSPVVIPAGSSSANILLSVTNDALDENNETIIVDLGTPVNCQLGLTSSHAISISDDDPTPSVSFVTLSQFCNEGSSAIITLQLSSASGKDITIPFSFSPSSSATGSGIDYSLLTVSPVTIPAGSTSSNISLNISGDLLIEKSETIIIELAIPDNAIIGEMKSHTIIINGDDTQPNVKCKDITLDLDSSGKAFINAMDIDNGSSDESGIESLEIDKSSFTCANIGQNDVSLIVTDKAGNSAKCLATVTVTAPLFAFAKDISILLDENGRTTISPDEVNNGSFSYCGDITLNLSKTMFDCTNYGENMVTLTVTDESGESKTALAKINVGATNHKPVFNSIADVFENEDALPVHLTISGITNGDCAGVNQKVKTIRAWASNDLVSNIDVQYAEGNATAEMILTFKSNASGNTVVSVEAKDDGGTANEGLDTYVSTFKVNVESVNDSPEFSGIFIEPQMVEADKSFSLVLPEKLFKDVDKGDVLALSASLRSGDKLPAWLDFNPTTRTFSGTPTLADLGNTIIRVTATDQGGVSASMSFEVVVFQLNASSITGTLFEKTSPLNGGAYIALYKKTGTTQVTYNLVTRTTNSSKGLFGFYNLTEGEYIVEASIIKEELYPNLLTTYYSSVSNWGSATPINLEKNANRVVDITMTEKAAIEQGNFHITGTIILKQSASNKSGLIMKSVQLESGNSLDGVTVVLMLEGKVIQSTMTNNKGQYFFKNLPSGNYQIEVSLPGFKQQEVAVVQVNTEKPEAQSVNFTVWEGTNIVTGLEVQSVQETVKVFPNPAEDRIMVEAPCNSDEIGVTILSASGQKLFKKQYHPHETISVDIKALKPGIYMVITSCCQKSFSTKLVKR